MPAPNCQARPKRWRYRPKETGMTFGQWRQQARLLRALELLATGEKVIDVALALGYESPSALRHDVP
jgi:methylphosphotriester-DNA--protein-cysteine methyltransferase